MSNKFTLQNDQAPTFTVQGENRNQKVIMVTESELNSIKGLDTTQILLISIANFCVAGSFWLLFEHLLTTEISIFDLKIALACMVALLIGIVLFLIAAMTGRRKRDAIQTIYNETGRQK